MTTEHYLIGTIKCIQQGLYENVNQMISEANILINQIKYKALPPKVQEKLVNPYEFIEKLSKGHYKTFNGVKQQANRVLKEYYK